MWNGSWVFVHKQRAETWTGCCLTDMMNSESPNKSLQKENMKSSRLSSPLLQSLRWAKWVVKCPCSELNRAYKMYMVCKEVLYIIPLIGSGERDSTQERGRQSKAMISDSDSVKKLMKGIIHSAVLSCTSPHIILFLCFSQLLAFL